ncbi:hypothetical protein MAXJ12_33439 [Mesorhizobium alhagi CCNWXJ12-2]|uniref:Uncharacterized protein n=1 Tax=Mesorhizobium alhagi CCNWXJ12-2 TaxID=1107882 RepID=H0I2I4_9HYPH|nr:hypothetical protein MAXJ12_33439 [Mesorhizobium alhagi CCNWXJ12-2]
MEALPFDRLPGRSKETQKATFMALLQRCPFAHRPEPTLFDSTMLDAARKISTGLSQTAPDMSFFRDPRHLRYD